MPTPRKGEEKTEYISRCIKYVMDNEDAEQKQAIGKCYGMWNYYQKKGITESNIIEKIDNIIDEEGTTVKDVDNTITAGPKKAKKKKNNVMRRTFTKCLS